MHIDDITAALAIRDIATIKEAFLVLANYPKGGDVTGLAAHNAMTFFEAAAQALRSDCTEMPDHGRKSIWHASGRVLCRRCGFGPNRPPNVVQSFRHDLPGSINRLAARREPSLLV